MTNVELLTARGELGNIRERLGAMDEDDTNYDAQINKMNATEIAETWAGWHIGDESWASEIIDLYREFSRKGR